MSTYVQVLNNVSNTKYPRANAMSSTKAVEMREQKVKKKIKWKSKRKNKNYTRLKMVCILIQWLCGFLPRYITFVEYERAKKNIFAWQSVLILNETHRPYYSIALNTNVMCHAIFSPVFFSFYHCTFCISLSFSYIFDLPT